MRGRQLTGQTHNGPSVSGCPSVPCDTPKTLRTLGGSEGFGEDLGWGGLGLGLTASDPDLMDGET